MVDTSQQRLGFGVASLTVIALGVLAFVLIFGGDEADGQTPSTLATINAALNASASVALVSGYALIAVGKRDAHRRAMTAALVISALFLVGYLVHHAQVGSVRYRGTGLLRAIYFGVLVPHVVLAAVGFPLILLTTFRALRKDFARHRAIAENHAANLAVRVPFGRHRLLHALSRLGRPFAPRVVPRSLSVTEASRLRWQHARAGFADSVLRCCFDWCE
ncbi:MAG: DUF420 domain-containing protein [Polyangiaceae bacterium]